MTTTFRDGNGEAISVTDLAVHECVARILADLPAIQKNGKAPTNMGGYNFRRVEDITAALKPLFAQYGVLCLPSVMSRIESQRSTSKGGILFCVDLEICFRFIGPQGDELATNVWGQGTDSGDKATQKAVTSAFKTMLSVVFCISDSEMDAEAHDVPETANAPARPAPAPKEKIDALVERIAELNLGDWVRDQGFVWPWTDAACHAIEDKADALTTFDQESAEPARDSEPAPTTSEVEPTPEPTFTRADGLAKDPAAEYDHPCEECGAAYPEHEAGCKSQPF